MFTKQLTVFVENRTGRLAQVLEVLKESRVSILSMSLADTTEFGLLRLIVDDPEKGKEKLTENGFSSLLTEVAIIKIAHEIGSLQSLLKVIDSYNANIEYMYGLSIDGKDAYVVLKASDMEKTEEIFKKNGVVTVSFEEIIGI